MRRNVREIADDPVLRVYGALLAAIHVLTFWFWHQSADLAAVLGPDAEPICWPFWESCWRHRFHDLTSLRIVVWSYGVLAVLPIVLFARRRWTALAWWSLLAASLVELAIVAQDFRLRSNQHYMATLAWFAFLFVPGKRDTMRMLIALFYFWAGLLKTNYEWLSGAALETPIRPFPGPLLPLACGYVVVLEVVLVWGLFSRRAWLFWATFAQLVLFQIVSWQRVGFYYPLMMLALLAIYPMARPSDGNAVLPLRFARGREAPAATAFLLTVCLLQLVPLLFPGESAVTGEGRMFALHMFDAAVRCEASVDLQLPDGSRQRHWLQPAVVVTDPLRSRSCF